MDTATPPKRKSLWLDFDALRFQPPGRREWLRVFLCVRGAWLSLCLAVGGVVLPLLALVVLWRMRLPGRTTPADAPVVQTARWLAVATLASWPALIVARTMG